MKITYHVYRTNCYESSRIMLQSSWDVKSAFIHKIRNDRNGINKSSMEESEYGIRSIFKVLLNRQQKKIVFHAQSSLPLLILSYLIILVTRLKNVSLIYDIHDLHEKINSSFSIEYFRYGIVRYHILKFMEKFVISKSEIKKMTVSSGLSEIISTKYCCKKPKIVYNAVLPKYTAVQLNTIKRNEIAILYFGSKDRLPTTLIDDICNSGFKLHLYGRDFSKKITDNSYKKITNNNCVKIFGEYSPDSIEFLLKYKYMIIFKPENNSDNFKYSLPNKLFQSLSHGISLIISSNFIEMQKLFSHIHGAVTVYKDNINLKELLSDINILRNITMFELLDNKLNELHTESMNNYKSIVN